MPPGLRMLAACWMKVFPRAKEASWASWKGGFMMTVSNGRWWGTAWVTSVQWYSMLVFPSLLASVRLSLAQSRALWSSS